MDWFYEMSPQSQGIRRSISQRDIRFLLSLILPEYQQL